MSVRVIKKSWWVDFRVNHTRYRKRSPTNSKKGAQDYESLLRQRITRGESIEGEKKQIEFSFEQFAEKWFNDYVVPNNKQQEQRMKRYILGRALIPFFRRIPVGRITTHDVEQFKAQALRSNVSRKTVNNWLAVLGKCVRTAYEWHGLPGSLPKIKLLKCPPPSTNYLSPDECDLLVAAAEGVIAEMILVALRTGMRQGEIRALQWSSIDWEKRSITVRHSLNDRAKKLESPKSNRERHIPLDIDLYEMLFKRKKRTGFVFLTEDGTPFDSQRVLRQLEKVREKAGLRHFTMHTLRHTFATQLAMRGVPLNIVKELLGHSTITMTMRYAHSDESAMRSAIDMLNPRTAARSDFGQPVGNQWVAAIRQETKNA